MFRNTAAFSSYSVDDLDAARDFYTVTLGLDVSESPEGIGLHFSNGGSVFIYPKPNHEPAGFTVLNFPVENIDKAADELISRGVALEQYGGDIKTDEKGVFRGGSQDKGPNIAWFKDPAGNILSIVEQGNKSK